MTQPLPSRLPRWRGFNLLEMFHSRSDGNWREDDFRWIADWGFDFVRLPTCYLLWTDPADAFRLDEAGLAKVDRAVELGRRCGLHVNLNLHRGPGYSVNRERQEPFDLWKDDKALEAFCHHWRTFARRYRGVAAAQLSFNLINEPPAPKGDPAAGMTRDDHARVVRAAVAAIRREDPDRLVVVDGVSWGNDPCGELADTGVAQSCRAYLPMAISHYEATWVDSRGWPRPRWPLAPEARDQWYANPPDRAGLEEHYRRWADLAARGVGVHCGEGGAYNRTPHDVVLRWLADVLEILGSHGIGWALWNFRGAFGVLDSGRPDVAYEDFRGHALDRKLLDLLRAS